MRVTPYFPQWGKQTKGSIPLTHSLQIFYISKENFFINFLWRCNDFL